MIELNSENLSTWKVCDWMASCGKWVFQVQRLSRGEMRLTLPSLCPCLSRFPFLCVSLRIRKEQLKINTRGARGASPAVRPGWYFYSSRKGNCRRQTYRTNRLCDLPLAPPALPMDHGFSSGCSCLARVPDNVHLLLICETGFPLSPGFLLFHRVLTGRVRYPSPQLHSARWRRAALPSHCNSHFFRSSHNNPVLRAQQQVRSLPIGSSSRPLPP